MRTRSLVPQGEDEAITEAEEALSAFGPQFERGYLKGLRQKLGLFTEHDEDAALAGNLLSAMAQNNVDFALFFRGLADAQVEGHGDLALRTLFSDPAAYDA